MFQVWFLPFLIIAITVVLSIPTGRYLAWLIDGQRRQLRWLAWIEQRLDTGPQSWKQYALSLLLFNTIMFSFGFIVLALQPLMPMNPPDPDGSIKGMLAPTTIFHTVTSFLTNTNLQHYSGEVHLSYFSQVFFILWNMFVSAAVGFCALVAIIRGLRGDAHMGNFYVDLWRVVLYAFVPASLIMGVLLLLSGVPMTLDGTAEVMTLEGVLQKIARGPVAAILPIKHLGTNGGGFFGANSAHPFENPSAWTNLLECMNFMLFPFSLVVMFGRMIRNRRHAAVIYGVMMTMLVIVTV